MAEKLPECIIRKIMLFVSFYPHELLRSIRMRPVFEGIRGKVYLVWTKRCCPRYQHVIRVPDYRRDLQLTAKLSEEDRLILKNGGIPRKWYPQPSIPKMTRVFIRIR